MRTNEHKIYTFFEWRFIRTEVDLSMPSTILNKGNVGHFFVLDGFKYEITRDSHDYDNRAGVFSFTGIGFHQQLTIKWNNCEFDWKCDPSVYGTMRRIIFTDEREFWTKHWINSWIRCELPIEMQLESEWNELHAIPEIRSVRCHSIVLIAHFNYFIFTTIY